MKQTESFIIVSEVSNMRLHERMKAIQTDSDVKIRTLSERLEVSEHSLGNYLNGKREVPYDVLVKFSRYYHVTADYLLGLTDDPALPFPLSAEERALVTRYRTLTGAQRELVEQSMELMEKQNRRR